MTCLGNDNVLSEISEILFNEGMGGLNSAITILINQAMQIERTKHLKANPYERSAERQGYANGFKDKDLKTRIGLLPLKIPQVRDGDFYPSFLEKGLRSERALMLSMAEMYVNGVSTRKVQNIMEQLCGFNVSSSEFSRAGKLLDEELSKWRERPLGKYKYNRLRHFSGYRHRRKWEKRNSWYISKTIRTRSTLERIFTKFTSKGIAWN